MFSRDIKETILDPKCGHLSRKWWSSSTISSQNPPRSVWSLETLVTTGSVRRPSWTLTTAQTKPDSTHSLEEGPGAQLLMIWTSSSRWTWERVILLMKWVYDCFSKKEERQADREGRRERGREGERERGRKRKEKNEWMNEKNNKTSKFRVGLSP